MENMRTRKELEEARQPEYTLEKRGGHFTTVSSDGSSSSPNDLVPKVVKEPETYEQQIHELLLDIRDLLQTNQKEL